MWRLDEVAERIYSGHRVNRVTVRDLLKAFGAERRGYWITQQIRARLGQLKLRTEPDFEHVWIDSFIRFLPTEMVPEVQADAEDEEVLQEETADSEDRLLDPACSNPAETATTLTPTETSPQIGAGPEVEKTPSGPTGPDLPLVALRSFRDHTFRIGNLASAHATLVTVNENDPLITAVTKMRQHDFSQLPVMQGTRSVRGMLSWKSIASVPQSQQPATKVGERMERPLVYDADLPLFSVTNAINETGYALVRNRKDGTITGIVTSSDLATHFQQLTLPFLLLREVELHVREILQDRVTKEDIELVVSTPPVAKPASEIEKLTFGQYVNLFGRQDIWEKLGIPFDQGCIVSQLDSVRKIRNEVMHFDPDPMSHNDLVSLQNAARFMRELLESLPESERPS